jgi:hypothetical protein
MSLADAITNLRAELKEAKERGEGERLQFSLGPVELELEMELQESANIKAGFKWVVVSAGGGVTESSKSRHRIKLTLIPPKDHKVGKDSDEPK